MNSILMPKVGPQLLVEVIGIETVVYHPQTKEIHRLEAEASKIFARCDGLSRREDVADEVFPGAADALDQLEVVLMKLADLGLFASDVRFSPNRREFLKRAASAALLGAVISTFMAPTAAQAQSAGTPIVTAICWVAVAAYGERDSRWLRFFVWVSDEAPAWFRDLYRTHGQAVAGWLDRHSSMKPAVRFAMNRVAR